jgi:serine/threonine protein kinase
MHYSKKIKRYIIPKIYLPSNYKIISTPHLQNLLSAPKASINDYEKLKELGAGSYANVILAKSNIDGKQFAIKVIKKDKLNVLYKQYEIDFVVNFGSKKYYIQSALTMPTIEKQNQEKRPLLKINDSFKKVVVVKDNIKPYNDENGIGIIGLKDFLLNENCLDSLI